MLFSAVAFADGVLLTPEEEKALESGTDVFPSVSAESYLVMDLKTGEVLFSNNEKTSLPIASTTKMLTALVVVENEKDLDRVVTVDARSCGIEGSSINLYEGEKMSVRDLLYALMLESANDAAVCLAISCAGSVEKFSELMNAKAEQIGMDGSHFTNPHGLEDKDHYSTALDLAKLWQDAMQHDVLREIVAARTHKIELSSGDGYRFLSNHNKLLKSYEACIGGKTGFTKASGRCLVSVCEKNGIELVTVTLNDPDDWRDHKNLCEYAFSLYSEVVLAEKGDLNIPLSVVGGKSGTVAVSNKENLSVWVRDVTKISSRVEAPRFLYAPVILSEKPVGRVVYLYNGCEIATLDLFSLEEIEIKMSEKGFFKRIWDLIFG